jgi:single-strand DNA-binding protein
MSETVVTVVGNVATQPELRQTSAGVPVTRFRLATTERRYDRASDRWTDGHTNFYTVWAWRALGENVCGSIAMGEPVIVQGKLRVVQREDKGQSYLSASIDATTVGHDLNRGTSAFRRVFKARNELADRSPDAMGGSGVSDAMWMQPPPSGGDGMPDSVQGEPATTAAAGSPSAQGSTSKSGSNATAASKKKPRDPELVPS